MSNKDFYMIGFNILYDVENYEGSQITKEEGEAIKTVKNVLARLYASKTMWDIRIPKEGNEKEKYDIFCDKVMQRIPVYHKAANKGIQD